VKRPDSEVKHSFHAKVNMEWRSTSTPPMWLRGNDRDNFSSDIYVSLSLLEVNLRTFFRRRRSVKHRCQFVIKQHTTDSCLYIYLKRLGGTAVAQWLRYCATNRKVAGSIPDGVTGIFH
jgi:hypothetical protein